MEKLISETEINGFLCCKCPLKQFSQTNKYGYLMQEGEQLFYTKIGICSNFVELHSLKRKY